METLRYEPLHREPLIEANGSEYLISFNGSVFLALSLADAQRIAHRMAGPRCSGAWAAEARQPARPC